MTSPNAGTALSGAMPNYTLTYFDMAASRGEECRLALHIAGVPFTDNRLGRAGWTDLKPATPFGSLPTLECEGRGVIAQSNAILAYVGRVHGMLPSDPWESARHEAMMEAVEDLRHAISPTLRVADDAEKKRLREALAAGPIPTWAANVERLLPEEGPFFGGAHISVADIKLHVVTNWIAKGVVDHLSPTLFDGYPKLTRLRDAVKAHPGFVSWYARS